LGTELGIIKVLTEKQHCRLISLGLRHSESGHFWQMVVLRS